GVRAARVMPKWVRNSSITSRSGARRRPYARSRTLIRAMWSSSAGEGPAGVRGGNLHLGQLELAADEIGAEIDADGLVEGDAAGEPPAAETAIRGEDEALRGHVLEGLPDEAGHELGRLHRRRRVVHHADGDLLVGAVLAEERQVAAVGRGALQRDHVGLGGEE